MMKFMKSTEHVGIDRKLKWPKALTLVFVNNKNKTIALTINLLHILLSNIVPVNMVHQGDNNLTVQPFLLH